MSELIGTTLGPYRLVAQLGQGGMATVYKAYHPAMDRYVAIKVLPRHMAQDPNFHARFQRETRTIARLEHRYILPVHDSGEQDGINYMVMRYTEGGTLSELIASGQLGMERAALLVAQIAEALGYAHRQGVIHRDIKPANVLISRDGDAQLSDFGIARIIEGTMQLTSDGMLIGTPFYMAPEQVQGQPSDARTDIYALGVVLYEALTGRRPYEAETPLAVALMHLHNPLPLPRQLRPDLPEAYEAIILRALAKNPADRFQSADDMAAALRAIAAPTEPHTLPPILPPPETLVLPVVDTTFKATQAIAPQTNVPTPPPALPTPPPSKRRWIIPAAIVATLLIMGVIAIPIIRSRTIRTSLANNPTSAVAPTRATSAIPPETPASAPSSIDASTPVNSMAISGSDIWAASPNGLIRWREAKPLLFHQANGLPFEDTRAVLADRDGTLWVAGYDQLVHVRPSDDRLEVLATYTPSDLKIDYVRALWRESDGSILAGGYLPSGLSHIEPVGPHVYEPKLALEQGNLPDGDILTIQRTSDGVLWVGTSTGLLRLKDGIWIRYDATRGLAPAAITQIVEHNGILWVTASERGLLRYNSAEDTWQHVAVSGTDPIRALAVIDNQRLWAAGPNFIAESRDDGATWTKVATVDAGDIDEEPTQIVQGDNGHVWVGGVNGLSIWIGSEWVTP